MKKTCPSTAIQTQKKLPFRFPGDNWILLTIFKIKLPNETQKESMYCYSTLFEFAQEKSIQELNSCFKKDKRYCNIGYSG